MTDAQVSSLQRSPSCLSIAPCDSASQVGSDTSTVVPVREGLAMLPSGFIGRQPLTQPSVVLSVASSQSGSTLKERTFECRKCKLVLCMSYMSPTKKGECKRDTASYKSLTERWSKDRRLRTWWNGLSPAETVEWYRKQHSISSGSKRKFDTVSVVETAVTSVSNDTREQDHWQPYWVFEKDGMAVGRTKAELETEWRNLVESPESEAQWVRGQWLVPRFTGVFKDKLQSDASVQAVSRAKTVESAEQLEETVAQGSKILQAYAESIQGPKQIYGAQPAVDTSIAEQPVTAAPVPVLKHSIAREVFWSRASIKTISASIRAD